MKKYDGWRVKSPKGYHYGCHVYINKKDAIDNFRNSRMIGQIEWQKYEKRGWKAVKVKLVEVEQ